MKLFQKVQNSLSLVASYLLLRNITLNVAQDFLRTSSETDRLLRQDYCTNELARAIYALYQENCIKFEALVLISGIKPNATSKFSGNCLFCA